MLNFLRRKWQSLVFRLLFYFLLSILALSLVLAFSFSQRLRPHIQQQILPNVERYLDYLVGDIGNPPDLSVARELAMSLPFELRIEGQGIEWSSSANIAPISNYRLRMAPAPYQSIYYGHARHQELVLIERHGLQYLFVVEDGFRRGAEQRHWLLFGALGAILLLLYLGIRRLMRPIAALSEQVRKIGEGDLEQSLDAVNGGELGMLAEGVNRMSRQIKAMLENKSGLLLAISHELRSPLTRMRVNLELLDDSDVRRQLVADTREMENLLGAILESEKLTSGHAPLARRRVDLAQIIREVVAAHPGRLRIRSDLAPLQIEIDELRIKLLLKNLLDNALQYSQDPGQAVQVSLRSAPAAAILEVVDRGIGIAADELPRLGEAFYRPDSARQRNTGGYGLGLYLCRLVCAAHGGELRIESEPGQGTRVIVSLPFDNS
jgi:signal transduction histidine kinase